MSLMRFVSWNVNGFRAISKKADWEWFSGVQADVVGLQETKASPDQLSEEQRQPEGQQQEEQRQEKQSQQKQEQRPEKEQQQEELRQAGTQYQKIVRPFVRNGRAA